MAIDFPSSPVHGNTYDYSGVRYTYIAVDGLGAAIDPGYWGIITEGTIVTGNLLLSFDSLTSAVAYISPISSGYPVHTPIKVASRLNKTECVAAGIPYPDGSSEEYVVVPAEEGIEGTGEYINVNSKQLKKNVSSIKPVTSIAALRLTEPSANRQQINLLGHTKEGVGGGNFFHNSALVGGENNSMQVVTLEGKVWVRMLDGGYVTPEMFGVTFDQADNTVNIQRALDYLEGIGGGVLKLGTGTYNHTGLTLKTNVGILGEGFGSILHNISITGNDAVTYDGVGESTASEDRATGQYLSNLAITGNPQSGIGVVIQLSGSHDVPGGVSRSPSAPSFTHLRVTHHGSHGFKFGNSANFGAGNVFPIKDCHIGYNGTDGILIEGQTNLVNVTDSMIANNGRHGVHLNFITSTCSMVGNLFADNVGWGVFAFSCEEPFVMRNGFNRNRAGSVAFSGSAVKSTEAGVITANLFGDNGQSATESREISVSWSKGTTISSNYFYATGQDVFVYLSDEAQGVSIFSNHFKDITSETKLKVKSGAANSYYTFTDDVSEGSNTFQTSNKVVTNVRSAIFPVFRNRLDGGANDMFGLRGDGTMSWGDGTLPTDADFGRISSGIVGTAGGLQAGSILIPEDSSATARSGLGRMYLHGVGAAARPRIIMSNGAVFEFTLTAV